MHTQLIRVHLKETDSISHLFSQAFKTITYILSTFFFIYCTFFAVGKQIFSKP